jgi:hypothetical protein
VPRVDGDVRAAAFMARGWWDGEIRGGEAVEVEVKTERERQREGEGWATMAWRGVAEREREREGRGYAKVSSLPCYRPLGAVNVDVNR